MVTNVFKHLEFLSNNEKKANRKLQRNVARIWFCVSLSRMRHVLWCHNPCKFHCDSERIRKLCFRGAIWMFWHNNVLQFHFYSQNCRFFCVRIHDSQLKISFVHTSMSAHRSNPHYSIFIRKMLSFVAMAKAINKWPIVLSSTYQLPAELSVI